MPSNFPVITTGEHLTIATYGVEKRLIDSFTIRETAGSYTDGDPCIWYNLEGHLDDGSLLEWRDTEKHLVHNTKRLVESEIARRDRHFQVDEIIQIGGHKFESRMLRCWRAELCHPDYPRLEIYLHEMEPAQKIFINNLSMESMKNQIVAMLVKLHQCYYKDAWNAVNYHE